LATRGPLNAALASAQKGLAVELTGQNAHTPACAGHAPRFPRKKKPPKIMGGSGAFMSYEVLVAIVVINAIVTFSLWRKVANNRNDRPRLKKKFAKRLWRSEPIVPKHDPPTTAGGDYPLADNDDRLFFDDFKDFADVVNWVGG